MAEREQIAVDELIFRIAEGLALSASGEWIVDIANQVLDGSYVYVGDDIVDVVKEDVVP